MIYIVSCRLAFTTEGQARGLFNHASGLINQAHTIHPGSINEERSFVRLEQCFHDETPPQPCDAIEEVLTN